MSQEALAERAGLSARGVSDIERGLRTRPRPDTLQHLADALQLSGDERQEFVDLAWRSSNGSSVRNAELPAPPTDRTTLPSVRDAFVGRASELDELQRILEAGSREIVTLTGPGGVGKTRLAVEIGHRLARAFAGGAVFVPLVTVTEAERVPDAIGQALQFPPSSSSQLATMLANRELLLILDNFEHVIDAAPFVAQLNDACPQLTILVTSRVRLRISAERVMHVSPLGLAHRTGSIHQQLASDANRLFAERARRIDPHFELTEQDAVSVTEICQRIDGFPLAIELAASRLRVLPVPVLLDRLDRRLPLLAGGNRDLHPRQHSMRETIAWSYELLDPVAQRYLRWMSVFGGGVSIESVDAIGQVLDLSPEASLELVTLLFDSALLQRGTSADGSPRFQLFETVREFGLEQLVLQDELEAAQRFHAEHFLALSRENLPSPYIYEPDEAHRYFDRLERERANLVQAFDTLCRPETAQQCMAIAGPMARFWRTLGPYTEGQARILRAIELAPDAPSIEKTHMLDWAVYLIGVLPDRELCIRVAHAAIAAADQCGTDADRAAARQSLAFVYEYGEQFDLALPIYEELIPIWEALGNPEMVALCLMLLGGLEYARGNLEIAHSMEERSAALFLECGDLRNAAAAHFYRGMFSRSQNRLLASAEQFDQSLRLWLEDNTERTWFKAFTGLADVAAALGMFEHATRMLGATDQLLTEFGAELMPFDRPGYARATEACQRALDPDRFAALVAEGKKLSPEECLLVSNAIVDGAKLHQSDSAQVGSQAPTASELIAQER